MADKSFGHFLSIFLTLNARAMTEMGIHTPLMQYFPSAVRYYHFVTLKIKHLQRVSAGGLYRLRCENQVTRQIKFCSHCTGNEETSTNT